MLGTKARQADAPLTAILGRTDDQIPGPVPGVAEYGAARLAVSIVAAGQSTGVPGLPQSDDWTAWDAGQMRAAVDYLERKRGGR